MRRATQFAMIAGVAGTFVLASARAAPNPFGAEAIADRAAAVLASAEAGSRAAMASRAGAAEVCFAGRPCPAPRTAICFASTTPKRKLPNAGDERSAAGGPPCPKAEVTFRFADAPPSERP